MFALSAAAPLAKRGRSPVVCYLLAVGFAVGAAALARLAPEVLAGRPLQVTAPWAPGADLLLALRMDALSFLFAMLVLGVGAIVMAYSARYFSADGSHGRLLGLLTLFAASMLGLVLADDVLLLFVFWELTSVTSFLLIGGRGGAGGKAATRALLTTSMGGLALLAGLVLMGITAGTFRLSGIIAQPGVIQASAALPAIMVLLLLGAFTKSAQVPFHYWLPGAMVAPTPVSTYLHAATMVKAGIYLLMRVAPIFADIPAWRAALLSFGLVTAVYGAGLALKQFDLKSLLAYSTVSQLGFLTALIGVGTPLAIAAAGLHVFAHALYKATLFMVVGIIDHEAGSRDIRELSGLRRLMPITATATGLAALSMAGIPPLVGFVSKEEAFAAFLGTPGVGWAGPVAAALAVTASIMTFAYGARIFDGAFEGPIRQPLYEPSKSLIGPPLLTAIAGLILGPTVAALDPLVNEVTANALGVPADLELALWHGFTPALGLSGITIGCGLALFLFRDRVARFLSSLHAPLRGPVAFDRLYDGAIDLGAAVGRPATANAPAMHFSPILVALAVVAVWAALVGDREILAPPPAALPGDWVVAVLLGATLVGAASVRGRLAAIALVGISGFLIAVWYVLLGAPDLALTQLLVETLTVAVAVLVLRRLPATFERVSVSRRALAAVVAVSVGTMTAVGAYLLTGRRELSDSGQYYLQAAEPETGGSNVVNTILVDFRALDTLGEITVLAVAAIGIFALAYSGRRRTR